MSRRVVIGIDPGKMTGVYLFCSDTAVDAPLKTEGFEVRAENMPFFLNGMFHLVTTHYGGFCHVAIERFIITSRTAKLSQQSDALEVTGMVKAVAAIQALPDVRQYLKANLKFASDDMLRSVGWHTPSMRHANDAARQAFALLKDVDYPAWAQLVKDGKLRAEDGRTHDHD